MGDDVKERPDGRPVHDQLDLDRSPTADEAAEWLADFGSTFVVVDLGNGPEDGWTPILEVVTATDDPDPYDMVCVRPDLGERSLLMLSPLERDAVVRALHEHGLRAGRAGDEEEERQMAKLERRLLNWGRS